MNKNRNNSPPCTTSKSRGLTAGSKNLDVSLSQQWLQPRNKDTHKNNYGHVLVIGGGLGMPGAAALAAHAAYRVGAGSVTVATWPDYAKQPLPGLMEAMIHGITDPKMLVKLIGKATVCILGPGLGEDDWAQQLFLQTISASIPLVIDASALRLLAKMAKPHQLTPLHEHCVLTPHPGEAAALLHCSPSEVQFSRLESAKRIQQQYGGSLVLKGAGSIVIDALHQVSTCTAGNPGMATAGMGDVLSGVIAGLIAQGISSANAARLGVWLHATAGDEAAKINGERGLIASDLMPFLQRLSNPVKPK